MMSSIWMIRTIPAAAGACACTSAYSRRFSWRRSLNDYRSSIKPQNVVIRHVKKRRRLHHLATSSHRLVASAVLSKLYFSSLYKRIFRNSNNICYRNIYRRSLYQQQTQQDRLNLLNTYSICTHDTNSTSYQRQLLGMVGLLYANSKFSICTRKAWIMLLGISPLVWTLMYTEKDSKQETTLSNFGSCVSIKENHLHRFVHSEMELLNSLLQINRIAPLVDQLGTLVEPNKLNDENGMLETCCDDCVLIATSFCGSNQNTHDIECNDHFRQKLENYRNLLLQSTYVLWTDDDTKSSAWPENVPRNQQQVSALELDLRFCLKNSYLHNDESLSTNGSQKENSKRDKSPSTSLAVQHKYRRTCQDTQFKIASYYALLKDDTDNHNENVAKRKKGYYLLKELAEQGHADAMCLIGTFTRRIISYLVRLFLIILYDGHNS